MGPFEGLEDQRLATRNKQLATSNSQQAALVFAQHLILHSGTWTSSLRQSLIITFSVYYRSSKVINVADAKPHQ